jgi:molybdopterin converting factor small subunit
MLNNNLIAIDNYDMYIEDKKDYRFIYELFTKFYENKDKTEKEKAKLFAKLREHENKIKENEISEEQEIISNFKETFFRKVSSKFIEDKILNENENFKEIEKNQINFINPCKNIDEFEVSKEEYKDICEKEKSKEEQIKLDFINYIEDIIKIDYKHKNTNYYIVFTINKDRLEEKLKYYEYKQF